MGTELGSLFVDYDYKHKMVRMLWTGGFDSTYLLLSLLNQGRTVQPLYVTMDPTWQKERRESIARKKIRSMLPKQWRLCLRKIKRLRLRDVSILRVNLQLKKIKVKSGWLDILVSLALRYPGIYIALVKSDHSIRLKSSHEVLMKTKARLPLADTSKKQILLEAERRGWIKYLQNTWSCDSFAACLQGPCGKCFPCRSRMLDNNTRLFKLDNVTDRV